MKELLLFTLFELNSHNIEISLVACCEVCKNLHLMCPRLIECEGNGYVNDINVQIVMKSIAVQAVGRILNSYLIKLGLYRTAAHCS